MKKINLNINIEDLEMVPEQMREQAEYDEKIAKQVEKEDAKTGYDVAKRFIENSLNNYMNHVTEKGKNNKVTLSDSRKINRIADAIDDSNKGVAELEDDHLGWLKKTFEEHAPKLSITGSKIFERVMDKLIDAEKESTKESKKEKE